MTSVVGNHASRVAVILTLGVFIGASSAGLDAQSEPVDGARPGGLLHASRANPTFCLQVSPSVDIDFALAEKNILDAVSALARRTDWARLGFPAARPTVVRGCSATPVLDGPDTRGPQSQIPRRFPRTVDTPGPIRTAIFILPESRIVELFGSAISTMYYRVSDELRVCGKSPGPGLAPECAVTTVGIYLSREEALSPEVSAAAVARSLNMLPPPDPLSSGSARANRRYRPSPVPVKGDPAT